MRISDWSSDVCSSDLACLPNSACRKKKATASSWPRARTGSKMRAMGRTRQRMPPNEPIRRCILSGERDERGRLIRLALSPDGLVLPDAAARAPGRGAWLAPDRAALENAISRSEEHTSELQSLMRISYAVFCLKKKTHITQQTTD